MISSIPSMHANTVAPYAPLGRQPVGQESTDLKTSSFKALEQSADSGRSQNRRAPGDNPNQQAEQDRLAGAQNRSVQPRDQQQGSDSNAKDKDRLLKEQKQIDELAALDRAVHAHEQAHSAVAGQYAGTTTYEFVKGPDGVSYAVGGEVSISTSPIPNDPEATIAKARQIRMAANAPADPSPQDRRVAAAAASMENEARAELLSQKAQQAQQAQQQSDGKVKAQKAEAEKQAANEDELRQAAKEEAAKRQAELDRSSAERAAIMTKSAQATFNITRRLVEIGAVKGTPSVGNLLNSIA